MGFLSFVMLGENEKLDDHMNEIMKVHLVKM
jgi:hypothetical protein